MSDSMKMEIPASEAAALWLSKNCKILCEKYDRVRILKMSAAGQLTIELFTIKKTEEEPKSESTPENYGSVQRVFDQE